MKRLLIIVVCAFSMTACCQRPKGPIIIAEQRVPAEPTMESMYVARVNELTIEDVVLALKEYNKDAPFDYCNITAENNTITMSVAQSGTAEKLEAFMDGRNANCIEWEILKNSMMNMYDSLYKLITLARPHTNFSLIFVDDRDVTNIFLAIYNGEFLFDSMKN